MPIDKKIKKNSEKTEKKVRSKNKIRKVSVTLLSTDAHTIEPAAEYLNVGKDAINNYVKAGFLPVYKEKYDVRGVSFKRYFLKSDLDKIKKDYHSLVPVELEPVVVESTKSISSISFEQAYIEVFENNPDWLPGYEDFIRSFNKISDEIKPVVLAALLLGVEVKLEEDEEEED